MEKVMAIAMESMEKDIIIKICLRIFSDNTAMAEC